MITLILGIGAATAVFSVVNTVLFEPLPYRNSDRLVRIVQRAAPANPSAPLLRRSDMSQVELSQWRKNTRTLSAMAISITPPITLMPTASRSARLTGSLVQERLVFGLLSFFVRTDRDPATLVPTVRSLVNRVDPRRATQVDPIVALRCD